jgi:hypothetical protein
MSIASFLVGFGAAALTWLAGLAAATFLQDREYIRRQRGAAGVLLTELKRIGGQLGGSDRVWIDSGILGHRAAIPEIHPWVHDSIAAVSESEPSILGHFMHLEMRLSNQALFIDTLRQVRDEAKQAVNEGATPATAAETPDTEVSAASQRILAKLTAKLERKERDAALRSAVSFVDMNHRSIVEALRSLESLLEEVDARLSREPTFNLRSVLGARVRLLRDAPERSE